MICTTIRTIELNLASMQTSEKSALALVPIDFAVCLGQLLRGILGIDRYVRVLLAVGIGRVAESPEGVVRWLPWPISFGLYSIYLSVSG